MKKAPFYIVDVFAEKPMEGNQLAVFPEGDLVPESLRQKIAAEINFSETTFVLSDHPKNGKYKTQIFLPSMEIPFAGHPILGTAAVLNERFNFGDQKIELILKSGRVEVQRKDGIWRFHLHRIPEFGQKFSAREGAQLLGIEPEDIDDNYPVQLISTGFPDVLIPLKSMDALNRIHIRSDLYNAWMKERKLHLSNSPAKLTAGIYTFVDEPLHAVNDLHARFFFLSKGRVREDAATGSAASCLLAYLLMYRSSVLGLRLEQGHVMGRPSLIYLSGTRGGDTYNMQIGGKVQQIASGYWEI